ncbi:FkbM family methyltransferase [Risungbinella massiliensis]|uniref:FkbM family methyltransferase n=1 Tax=Risungbinella massiliensis TaxID=1329796 RepID=UPI0005CBBB45|nr:FkbM family methyltransferase [Risungbinella massiliensis]
MDRKFVYIGNHTVITQLLYGPKIFVDTRDLSVSPHLILDGYWEDWISRLLLTMIKPEMTFLDIGAHCGYFSLLASYLVGPKGKVHAFEPNPHHHENFLKSKIVNGFSQLELHKVALANEDSDVMLYIPNNLTASATIHEKVDDEYDHIEKIQVRGVNLDSYLPDLTADIIKIDIEGAEPLIMDSLFSVIRRSPDVKIIMEFNRYSWESDGHNSEEILNRFVNEGFSISVIQYDASLKQTSVKKLLQMTTQFTHFDLFLSRI